MIRGRKEREGDILKRATVKVGKSFNYVLMMLWRVINELKQWGSIINCKSV